MIDLTILNEPQLARIYLVANTPSYLYRNYRADSSVFEMASRNSVDDLISFVLDISSASERKLRQVVFAYAAIVALTFKNQREVAEKTANVSFKNLDWAQKILRLGQDEQTTNLNIVINIPPRIEQRADQPSAVTNTVTLPIEIR